MNPNTKANLSNQHGFSEHLFVIPPGPGPAWQYQEQKEAAVTLRLFIRSLEVKLWTGQSIATITLQKEWVFTPTCP